MTGPLFFVVVFGLLLAYAARRRYQRPYLFAEEFEAALHEMAQHMRAMERQVGMALLPAVKSATEAMAAFARALQDEEAQR